MEEHVAVEDKTIENILSDIEAMGDYENAKEIQEEEIQDEEGEVVEEPQEPQEEDQEEEQEEEPQEVQEEEQEEEQEEDQEEVKVVETILNDIEAMGDYERVEEPQEEVQEEEPQEEVQEGEPQEEVQEGEPQGEVQEEEPQEEVQEEKVPRDEGDILLENVLDEIQAMEIVEGQNAIEHSTPEALLEEFEAQNQAIPEAPSDEFVQPSEDNKPKCKCQYPEPYPDLYKKLTEFKSWEELQIENMKRWQIAHFRQLKRYMDKLYSARVPE
jgi:hypothetical protein